MLLVLRKEKAIIRFHGLVEGQKVLWIDYVQSRVFMLLASLALPKFRALHPALPLIALSMALKIELRCIHYSVSISVDHPNLGLHPFQMAHWRLRYICNDLSLLQDFL
jgi:hypothetical protein